MSGSRRRTNAGAVELVRCETDVAQVQLEDALDAIITAKLANEADSFPGHSCCWTPVDCNGCSERIRKENEPEDGLEVRTTLVGRCSKSRGLSL
jgi:hypothetical protein